MRLQQGMATMIFTGRVPTDHGVFDLIECEHCGHKTDQPKDSPIEGEACRKCGMTSRRK